MIKPAIATATFKLVALSITYSEGLYAKASKKLTKTYINSTEGRLKMTGMGSGSLRAYK
ncbi:hypothetical protein HCH_00092 [Hahella chejuensis KCTC 2396]|uniref:Uncharacterized protein n=1 Tax=Hahella chejuensis (strain KCTC 2396) TaxID=349521 RepID=Q2SQR1_HAHCH|nr:hypothetical protein HCH_00092 [Hahella chejuensis KCTC 2396]